MTQYNFFQKDWPRIKKELVRVSQEARDLAKKGEAQFIQISRRGKVQLDSAALALKKEHLCFLMGKEYLRMKCPGKHSAKMDQLIAEIKKIEGEIRQLGRKAVKKARSSKRKSAGKKK